MNLKETIKHLQEVIMEMDLSVPDVYLFEQAIKIMISRQIGEQKKENIANMTQNKIDTIPERSKQEFKGEFKRILKASDKQKRFIKNLGFLGDVDILSMQDAKAIIDELKSNRRSN